MVDLGPLSQPPTKQFQLKSGDLLCWTPNNPMGHFVSMISGSKVSHVGILWVFRKRFFILESIYDAGVRLRALSSDLPVIVYPTTIKWDDRIETLALDQLGKTYSYWDAFRIATNRKPLYFDSNVCSHYCAKIYYEAGLPIPTNQPLIPDDIIKYILAHNGGISYKLETLPIEGKQAFWRWTPNIIIPWNKIRFWNQTPTKPPTLNKPEKQ